jgi:small-conductance mechanosensitive channel
VSSLAQWPWWATGLFWTAATVGGAYVVGQVVRLVLGARLARLARRTRVDWDDVLLSAIGQRLAFWSLLIGVYLSLERWPLTAAHALLTTRALSAMGVASITMALATIATRLVLSYGVWASVPVSGLTQNLVRGTIIVLGALVIVRSFGYDITPMLTALGVGGLAVALALQDPLSNLFAGLFVSFAGSVRIGDYVRLDSGAEGYVVDFTWRSTRLRQLGDNLIEVPNAKLAQAIVTNYTLPMPDMGIGVDLVIDPANDLARVERVALEVARDVISQVPGAVATAEPAVRFGAFTDTGVRVSVGYRVQTFVDQFLVRHEMIKQLHARFAEEGIRLPETAASALRATREG